MAIEFIAFMPGVVVSVGHTKVITMPSYSRDRHADIIGVERTASGIKFTVLDGGSKGDVIELPMTAIASIRTKAEKPAAKVEGKAK